MSPNPPPMSISVTSSTQSDQVLLRIVSQPAPRFNVVNLELIKTSAILAAPSIAHQHLLTQSLVGAQVEPQTRSRQAEADHLFLT